VKKFKFKFESLIKVRVNERDMLREHLARLLRRDAELLQVQQQVESERLSQLDDLRRLAGPGQVDIDSSLARRFYAGQLVGDLGDIDRNRRQLAGQIDHGRQALIQADQGVRMLEKLAEKEAAAFHYVEERRSARELEESWQAIHAGENRAC